MSMVNFCSVQPVLGASLRLSRWAPAGRLVVGLICLLAVACQGEAPVKTEAQPTAAVPCPVDPVLHTAPCLQTVPGALQWLSGAKGAFPAGKFVLARFNQASGPAWFTDPGFYAMHDEWYWFRLLSGYAVDGQPEKPKSGLQFASMKAAYAWLHTQSPLPYDLAYYGDRVYSKHFYDLAGFGSTPAAQRYFGVGTLIYMPADAKRPVPEAVWLFELEYEDPVDEAGLVRFLERLRKIVPTEIGEQLRWVAQSSPYQMGLAKQLRQGSGPLSKRVVTWADLVSAGEVQGYTAGITAGRVHKLPAGAWATSVIDPSDIVILADVPPALPPVAGILTALPQTPQAHLNLLAAARGTPNAWSSGVFDDKIVAAWDAERTPIALEVQPTKLRWKPMTQDQWSWWRAMNVPPTAALPVANLVGAPVTVSLVGTSVEQAKALLPLIGGKAMGLSALASLSALSTPPQALALTVVGYDKHIKPLVPAILVMLSDTEFKQSSLTREIVLEGPKAYTAAHGQDSAAMQHLAAYLSLPHPKAIDGLLAADGLREAIRHQPLDAGWLAEVRGALNGQFGNLSHGQGLRFRSSSTAEDIDGFNGAGVYISTTGFLFSQEQQSKKDREKTVERAIADVWASYWSSPAFEERRLAGIPHLQGRMAIAVHPKFDDGLESANGVALLAYARRPEGELVQFTVDVQPGSLSVTNPPPGVQAHPEIDRVTQTPGKPLKLERVQAALDQPTAVLSDAELQAMYAQVAPLAGQWLDAVNAKLAPEEQSHSLVLDFEFRRVLPGWPMLLDGTQLAPRLVWKQVRTLEHVGSVTAAHLQGAKAPRDVLHAAQAAWRRTCTATALEVELTELTTNPAGPAIDGVLLTDFATVPLMARAVLRVLQPIGALTPGKEWDVSHAQVSVTHPPMPPGQWAVEINVPLALGAVWGWQRLAVDSTGKWRIRVGPGELSGEGMACVSQDLAASKETWLRGILGPE